MTSDAVTSIRFAGMVCLAIFCFAGCAGTTSKPGLPADTQAAPFCSEDAARQCDMCVNACSDSLCTLNRDQCDPRGLPLGLPFATMYRRCASDCSYKVNGLKPSEASAPAPGAAAQPPCICQQPRPIPGAF